MTINVALFKFSFSKFTMFHYVVYHTEIPFIIQSSKVYFRLYRQFIVCDKKKID